MSAIAYTGQTPDGFIHTNFSGPLSLFDGPSTALPSDVLAIGDGSGDASELASLLKSSARGGAGQAPLQLSVESGSTPGSTQVSVLPGGNGVAAASTDKASLEVSSSPVLDANGKPDCSEAVSCVVDPETNATTVTLANGVVAVVQTVNDMTLVAYKSVGDVLQSAASALSLPGGSISNTIQALAPQLPDIQLPTPTATPSAPPVAAAAVVAGPAVDAVDAGPVSPGAIGSQPAVSPTRGGIVPSLVGPDGPTVTISRAPQDFGTPRTGNPTGTAISPTNSGAVNTVKGAVDSAFNAVRDAVGKIGNSTAGSSNSSTPDSSKPSGRP